VTVSTVEPAVLALIEEYQSRLTASLEMLTGESVSIRAFGDEDAPPVADALKDPSANWLWSRFDLATSPATWVATGATELAGKAIGAKVLLAAGIEEMNDSDVAVSYGEVQQAAVSALAHWLSGKLGKDVSAGTAVALDTRPQANDCVLLRIELEGRALDPLCLVIPAALRAVFSNPRKEEAAPEASQTPLRQAARATVSQDKDDAKTDPAIARILDFELPLRVSFGKAQLPLKEVLKLGMGSIIELDRAIGDPVEIIVNQRVVARGEVVVVDGNYGVSIRELTSGCG
jgi:flagellar motor switch protein FliN